MLCPTSIRISNLKSLEDTGYIDLKPINILLGANSSGKSTFARIFPLIKQSIKAKNKLGPIVWFDDLTDLGTFEDAVLFKDISKKILVGFKFKLSKKPINYTAYKTQGMFNTFPKANYLSLLENLSELTCEIELAFDKLTYVSSLMIEYRGNDNCFDSIKINIDSTGNINEGFFSSRGITRKLINLKSENLGKRDINMKCSLNYDSRIFPELYVAHENVDVEARLASIFPEREFLSLLTNYLGQYTHGNVSFERRLDFALRTSFMVSPLKLVNLIQKEFAPLRELKGNPISQLSTKSEGFIRLKYSIFMCFYNDLIRLMNLSLLENFGDDSLVYLDPFRNPAQRYYRAKEITISNIDAKGSNIANFMDSLSATEKSANTAWMSKNIGFSITSEKAGGNIQLFAKFLGDKKFNIIDVGYGLSQLMPLALQIWNMVELKSMEAFSLLIIEQPELHLHPKMQAKFADLLRLLVIHPNRSPFFSAIIETHSETIIHRLGELLTNGDIDPDNVQILIFNKHKGLTTISKSGYNKKGYLENWPIGFFHYN